MTFTKILMVVDSVFCSDINFKNILNIKQDLDLVSLMYVNRKFLRYAQHDIITV